MKTDIYTKIVLTVIATCLTINLLKEFDIITTTKADTTATTPAPIPNAVQSAPVDVNITHINGNSLSESSEYKFTIPVKVYKNYDK